MCWERHLAAVKQSTVEQTLAVACLENKQEMSVQSLENSSHQPNQVMQQPQSFDFCQHYLFRCLSLIET